MDGADALLLIVFAYCLYRSGYSRGYVARIEEENARANRIKARMVEKIGRDPRTYGFDPNKHKD